MKNFIRNSIRFFATCGLLCSALTYADGQLKASDTDSAANGVTARLSSYDGVETLRIDYRSDLNVCDNNGDVSAIDLKIVFVLGEGDHVGQYEYPISYTCPNGGTRASFSFDSKYGRVVESWRGLGPSDPYIWDRVFPKNSNGARCYALRVYFVRSHRGTGFVYDKKKGGDYRLIFAP